MSSYASDTTHDDEQEPDQSSQKFQYANHEIDKSRPGSPTRSDPSSRQPILLVLTFRDIAQHPEYPVGFESPRTADEVVGEQGAKERGGRDAKRDEEEWDVTVAQGWREP